MTYNKQIIPNANSKYILGDSLIELKKLKDQSIDMVFSDPPYNLQLSKTLYRPDSTRVSGVNDEWDKFDNFKDYDIFTESWLSEVKRILKPDGCLWVIGSYHNIHRIGYTLQNLNFWILNDIIWRKTNPMPNFKGTRFTNAHETLIWAAKSKYSKYTFNYQRMKQLNHNKQMRSDDWLINICSGRERLKDTNNQKLHNTQKPEELLLRVILSSTKTGDLVLDPFFGTGTTGVACKRLGRKFIGIEKNATYLKEAKKRILKTKRVKSEEIKLLNKRTFKKINIESMLKYQ